MWIWWWNVMLWWVHPCFSFEMHTTCVELSSSWWMVVSILPTVRNTINVENRWRGVFSLSYGGIETSNHVRLTGIIETHRAHLVRSSDSNERLRKNFKTAGIWDWGLECGILTSHPSIKMSNFNQSASSDPCQKSWPNVQFIERVNGGGGSNCALDSHVTHAQPLKQCSCCISWKELTIYNLHIYE